MRANSTCLIAKQIAERNETSAGNGSWTAPTRDLNGTSHSAIRQPGNDTSPTAGKDEKLSRGAGQSPAAFAREARLHSSLDKIKINRDTPRGRKRYCGAFTARGRSRLHAGKMRYHHVGCKCWDCARCGPRRAALFQIRIREIAEKRKLSILLTLTLDPAKLHGQDSTRYINEVFASFRTYLRRKLGYPPDYIRVLEYQKNGNAHLHVLLNCYVPQAWVSEVWSALGGGRVVDIKRVSMKHVARYLSKYLTKEMLLRAPKRARRVTTSRGIRLLEKQPTEFDWELMRVPILRAFDYLRASVTAFRTDNDRCLVLFETFEAPAEGRNGPSH